MNFRGFTLFLAALLLFPSSSSATSLNLFELQKITSFPARCTAAYDIEISDCTASEITVTGKITPEGKGICSLQCIAALSIVNRNLNAACAGLQASPDTLIGLFFSQKGIMYLCPNSVEGNGPAPSSTGGDSSATSTSESSSASASSSTRTSSPLTTTTSTTTSSSSSESTAAAATEDPAPSFQPTTAANNGVATVFTSEAQRTDSANPDAFGGGGSPFEVTANAASSGRVGASVPTVLCAAIFWGILGGCWIVVGG